MQQQAKPDVACPLDGRVRPLCALDEADDEQQHNRPDCGNNDAADEAATERNAKGTEQEAAEECANDTNDEIAKETKPSALDENSSQPTGHKTDNEEPEKVHFTSPVTVKRDHWAKSVPAARGTGKRSAGRLSPVGDVSFDLPDALSYEAA